VTLYKGLSGQASCGCFGKVESSPWYTLMIDLSAVVMLLFFRPQISRSPFSRNRRYIFFPMIFFPLIGLPISYGMIHYTPVVLDGGNRVEGNERIIVLQPEKWIGKSFPLGSFIDIGNQFERGTWLVVFYRNDCDECRQSVSRLEQIRKELAGREDLMHIALIEVPPYGSDLSVKNTSNVVGKLTDAKKWFIETPATCLLRKNVVCTSWEKGVPKLEQLISVLFSN